MPVRLLAIVFAVVILAVGGFANSKRPLKANKLDSAPTIDGIIDDEVWKGIESHTDFWDVTQGRLVSEQTKVRVGYDAKFIYVSFEMTDSQPDQIHAAETQEDSRFTNSQGGGESFSEDLVDVRFDPFNTSTMRGSSIFSVNAIGTRSALIGGGRAKKTEWKGEWKAFVKRTATGWTAEMQVPWQILNYPHRSSPQNMGINFFRYHQRLRLPSYWSNIGPNFREELQGIWEGVQTPAPPRPKMSVLPYVIGGIDDKNRPITRAGLDVRYPITTELTAVGTINPDFGTIEGAVESVGFSRTERFVPERRPFFLEGSGFFQAGMGFDIGQFFYARRIDRFDFGTKIYGKLNKKDSLGVLQTFTFGERFDTVANWSHQTSPFESYGIFANIKNSETDKANVVTANYMKEWGKLAYTTRYARSDNNGTSALASSNTMWYSDKRLFSFLAYNDTNDAFRLPDGLLGFRGIRGWELYNELPFEWRSGPVRTSRTEFSASWNSLLDGSPFQRGASLESFVGFRNGWGTEVQGSYYDYGGPIDRDVKLSVVKGWDNRFSKIGASVGGGTIESQKSGYFAVQAAQRIAKGLDVGYSGFFQNYQGHTQQNVFTVAYELTPTRSFGGRVVTQGPETNWYLSFRDAGKKGTEWFVIVGDPNARKFRRMLQVKAVFAF